MKKLILVGLLLISCVWGKSVEQLQGEWQQWITTTMQELMQRFAAKMQTYKTQMQQNEDFMRLMPHCYQLNDKTACERILNIFNKQCNSGSVEACVDLVSSYTIDEEMMVIKADLKKAQSYADKVCTLDATFCAAVVTNFFYLNRKIALKYAEKACEMGELSGCCVAGVIFSDGGDGVDKNPQKVKYYTEKLCKGGVSEACGK